MTVSTATSRVDYTGNGVTTVFAVPFPFIEDSYLTVIRTVVATGVETTLTLNSGGADGYTVSGAGQPVGSVAVVTAPTGGQRLSVIRAVPGTQEADFVANDPFPAETFENGLDKLQMQINDNATRASRSPVLYDSDIDGSGRYNSNGNRYANAADGVSATDLATVQQIISAGSGNFVQAGAGSVIRTAQDKMRERISVLDYFSETERAQVYAGTLADFSTSIQKAIDYAESFSGTGGAAVIFPAGRYGYTSLTIDENNVVLKAEGEVYLIKMSATGNGIVVGNKVGRTFGVDIREVQMGSAVAGVSGNLVTHINTGQCGLFDVTLTAAFGAPWVGIRVTNASQLTFSNCQVQDCGADGIVFEDCVDLYIDNSRSDSNTLSGFVFNKVSGLYGSNVTAYDNGVHGFSGLSTFVSPTLATQNQHWFLSNWIGDTSGSHNWNITQLSQARLVSCWAATHRVTAVDLYGFTIANGQDVEFNACVATNNNAAGLFIQSSCSHIRVIGGGYHGNGVQAGSANRQGIYSDTVDTTFSGVTCTDDLRAALALPLVQQYGIRINGSALVRLVGCNLRGNAVGPLQVASSGANIKEFGCDDNVSNSYASADPTTTVGAIGDLFTITGTADIYDIRPRWKGRRLTLVFSSTARLLDKSAGSAFALPTPAVQPGAFGSAEVVFDGTNWILVSTSVNDGV